MKDKIIELFEELDINLSILLQCERAGQEVDNGFGMEFTLPEYAIICNKDPLFVDDSIYETIIKFEFEEDIRFLKFGEDVYDVKGLLEGLNADGYKVIYNSKD